MSEIPQIKAIHEDETTQRGQDVFTYKYYANLIIATVATFSSAYMVGDTLLDEHKRNELQAEAITGVGEKNNPCSSNNDSPQCQDMMRRPTIALVYPAGSGIKTKPIVRFITDAIPAVTGGESTPKLTLYRVGGKIGELMSRQDCIEPASIGSEEELPLSVRAAKQEPAINKNDFVLALIPRDYCETTKYDMHIGGLAYQEYGSRFSEVYAVDPGFADQRSANIEYGRRVIHELVGHSMFGLGHDNGLQLLMTEQNDNRPYDLDERVAGATLLEYGGDDSVMGSSYIASHDFDTARRMFTPMELEDISPANRIRRIDIQDTGSAVLPAEGEGVYLSIQNDQVYSVVNPDNLRREIFSDELICFVDTDAGDFKSIQIYARAKDDRAGQSLIKLTSFDYRLFKYDRKMVFRDRTGRARVLKIEQQNSDFLMTVSRLD